MKPIGILGLGDLGSQLAVQIKSSGFEVIAFDSDKTKSATGIRIAENEKEVLESCSIVHWAIPSKSLDSLRGDPQDVTVVLHDSVMNNSQQALSKRSDSARFVIAHCLMNEAKRVFIAFDGSHSTAIMQHFETIGLNPKLISVKDHDVLMAHSQGILASLIELGLRSELDRASLRGDLTPSADELHRVLMNRELNWTPNTLESILANPALRQIAKDILATAHKR